MIARGYISISNVNDGRDGEDGIGIKQTSVDYAIGASPTEPPGQALTDGGDILKDESGNILTNGIWTQTIPVTPDGLFLWSRTTIIDDNDQVSYMYSIAKKNAEVARERDQYYLSDSNNSLTGGAWTYEEPSTIPEDKYLWGRIEITMTDGSVRYSDAVFKRILGGVISKADEAQRKITQRVWQTDITSSIDAYDGTTTQSIRDRVSSTETDLDGIHTTISDMQTTVLGDGETSLISRIHNVEDTAAGHTRTIENNILGNGETSLKSIANSAKTTAEQAADHFSWIVQSGTSSSNMTLTQDAIDLISEEINIEGKVTFDSFESATKAKIQGITKQEVTYARSASPTTQPAENDWQPNPTADTNNKPYMWQKTVTKDINGTITSTQIICITGQKGEGISSTNIEYGVSSSATEEPGKQLTDGGYILKDKDGAILTNGAWQSSVPSVPPGFFLWTKTHTVYTNGTETVSYSVSKSAVSIVSTVPYYCLSTTRPTTTPLNDVVNWSASPQNYQIGKLYWKCEVITYDNHTQSATQIVEDKGLNSANERAYLAYTSSVNVDQIMNAWTSDAITSTTTINGGYIKTHTINSEHLATNAIMSQNFLSYNNNTKPFSQTGSYLDLANGNFFSPTFAIINSVLSGSGITAGAYFNGHINAQSLTLGGDVKIGGADHVSTTPGIQITTAGLLKAYNAEISGNITAKGGAIGGWNITTDKLWYGNQAHGAATEAFILTPKGETVNAAIGGASGSNKWAMSIGKSFGVTTNGYMYANSGKIGGWTISGSALYNGTSAMTGTGSTTAGIYIGTDGIRNYNSANSYVSISGGKITAKGADISGTITATSGSFTGDIIVGSLHIDGSSSSPKIYYNITQMSEKGTKAGFYLGPDGVAIGKGFWADASGNTSIKSGTTIGNTTIGGTTVVNNINIGSNVTGTGNNQKTQTSLQYGKDSLSSTAAGFYLGTDGISIGENNIFKIDASGTTGTIGKIGPWYIDSTSISKNSNGSAAGTHNTTDCMYFGNSGLSISKAFVVDNTGILTAEDANIRGEITAKEYKMYKKSGNKEIETSVIKAQLLDIGGKSKEIIYGNNSSSETGKSYLTLRYGTDTGDGYALLTSTQYITLDSPTVNLMADSINLDADGQICIGSTTPSNDAIKLRDVSVLNNQTSEGNVNFTRLDIGGGIKTSNTIYTWGNYRIRYKTEKSNGTLNSDSETTACIENIKPPSSLLSSFSNINIGSGSNETCIKFGGSLDGACIVMKPSGGNMYVQLSHNSNLKWYDLHSCLEKALNASDSGSATSVSPSDTTPKAVASSSSKGSETAYARGDHQHSISVGTGDSNGQVKIAGQNASVKGLGSAAYKNTTDFLSSNTSFLSGATNTSATTSGTDISLGSDTSRQYLIGIGHPSDIEITGLFYVKYSNGWKYYRIHKGSKLNNPTISGNTITLKTTEGTGVGFYCKIK